MQTTRNLKKSIEFIINRRQQELQRARDLYQNLIDTYDAFYQLDIKERQAVLSGQQDAQKEVSNLKTAFYKKIGFDKNSLTPAVYCKKCLDTAFLNGDICNCVRRHYIQSMRDEFGDTMLACFEKDIDLNYHGAEFKQQLKTMVDTLHTLCNKYPNVKKNTVYLYGNTGTGKTHIAKCMANQLINNSHSIIYSSSYSFFNDMQKYHTTFDDTKADYLQPYLDCDVFILDDLGTEPMLKNITGEYLYILISERQNANKLTIYTSNHTENLLTNKYGSKIQSRLFNKNLSLICNFGYQDQRSLNPEPDNKST